MSDLDLSKIRSAHFIGIGGIGISAIARLLLLQGAVVSGSDRDRSKITDELGLMGATIHIGQEISTIPKQCECIIYTVAIPENNPELIEARARKLPLYTYPQTLAALSKSKYTIAIAGTHGKTTTTAMTAHILIDALFDPTVIVGSLMKKADGSESNFIAGTSEYLVVEADEYKKSFHNLYPKVLVINNLDEDHLDYYKDLADIQSSFRELALRIPTDGYVICNLSDPHVAPVVAGLTCNIVDYPKLPITTKLKVPGSHNRSNAQAAAAVATTLGIDNKIIEKSLAEFGGVWRRFEYKGTTFSGVIVYDDYAHNPQKVQALLSGAREHFGPRTRIVAVFQPHLYSRTKSLLELFARSFGDADEVILVPIFAAREALDPTISSDILADRIRIHHQKVTSFPTFVEAEEYLKKSMKKGEILITIGAGEAYKIGESVLSL